MGTDALIYILCVHVYLSVHTSTSACIINYKLLVNLLFLTLLPLYCRYLVLIPYLIPRFQFVCFLGGSRISKFGMRLGKG